MYFIWENIKLIYIFIFYCVKIKNKKYYKHLFLNKNILKISLSNK